MIADTTQIGDGTEVGHYVVAGDHVRIGRSCRIGHHVVIHAGTRIGDFVRIDDHAVIGKQPMRAANSAITSAEVQPPCTIADHCLIGTGVVLYAGCAIGERVLVADLASVRENVTIGAFTIVGRGVVIENKCRVGRHCKIETNAYITAYSELEDRVFVAPGVLTSNDNFLGRTADRFRHFKGVTVRRGGRLGLGAVILPGKEVGADAVIAAGALLTRDAASGKIHSGVPALVLRDVPDEQLLDNQGWTD